jgi:hypothetical protein
VVAVTLLPLKSKDFQVELAGEEKVGGKPAVGVKATGPDGKDFTIYFDKESGLPLKVVSKVAEAMGGEFKQETTFEDYKEMDGIKKATTVKATRDGEKFSEQKITEFKVPRPGRCKTFAAVIVPMWCHRRRSSLACPKKRRSKAASSPGQTAKRSSPAPCGRELSTEKQFPTAGCIHAIE